MTKPLADDEFNAKLMAKGRRKHLTDDEFDDLSEAIEDAVENTLLGQGFSINVASEVAREVTATAEMQLRTSLHSRRLLSKKDK